ncbi:MAG: hypothetical protein PVJ39_18780 [Gammaproteobacteria bacterium]|jgi:hypothetical protein
MRQHTFLLSEGYWKASGTFRDEHGKEYPVSGETIIRHLDGKWVKKGVMRVVADRPINFHNDYEIEPLQDGAQQTNWTSHNPGLGPLTGTFAIDGDQLVSDYQTADQQYKGNERFIYQDDDLYQVEGALYKGGKKVSSWTVALQRQPHAASATKH